MPIRITPRGMLLTEVIDGSDKWKTTKVSPTARLLDSITTVEPGTKLETIFDAVAENDSLVEFLSGYCWCDVAAINSMPRGGGRELLSPNPSPETVRKAENDEDILESELNLCPAQLLIMEREAAIYEIDGDREILERIAMYLGRFDTEARQGVPRFDIEELAGLSQLEFRLSKCLFDDDKEPTTELETKFTLLEVLSAVYNMFGTRPELHNMHQNEIDDLEDMRRRLIGGFRDPADWWKDGNLNDEID